MIDESEKARRRGDGGGEECPHPDTLDRDRGRFLGSSHVTIDCVPYFANAAASDASSMHDASSSRGI